MAGSTVAESGRHLQEVVDILLTRIENTSAELAEAKHTQEDLLSKLAESNSQLAELKR